MTSVVRNNVENTPVTSGGGWNARRQRRRDAVDAAGFGGRHEGVQAGDAHAGLDIEGEEVGSRHPARTPTAERARRAVGAVIVDARVPPRRLPYAG
jgi:hypothetical protein